MATVPNTSCAVVTESPVCTFSLCHCSYIGELEEKARILEWLFYWLKVMLKSVNW